MKMDADTVNKINKLAATLRNTGLAKDLKEAVEKAKEIILGEEKKDESIEEIQEDLNKVEDSQEDDKNGFYFGEKEDDGHDNAHPAHDVKKKTDSELLEDKDEEESEDPEEDD